MEPAKFNKTPEQIDTSNDSVIIVHTFETIPGGRTLDVTNVTGEVLTAGHVIIEETSSGNLKPLGVTDGNYDSLPGGHTYKGVLNASILVAQPTASIMVRGTVNEEAFKNSTGLTTPSGAKTALTLIRFTKD